MRHGQAANTLHGYGDSSGETEFKLDKEFGFTIKKIPGEFPSNYSHLKK